MRCSLLLAAALALLVAGCATAGTGQRDCSPILSWASPAYKCGVAKAPEPEPEPEEPVAEPEPEEKEEPEPEAEEPEERVEVKDEAIEIAERVQFRSGSADIMEESEKLLDEVAEAMKEHPEILRLRVEGHTDSRAGSSFNRKLSRARARAVRKYLISQGVEARRLVARGYGEKDPVETNKTQEGRYKNRRVEFKILKKRK
jgi:OmpA-OmpF porin, OOP family